MTRSITIVMARPNYPRHYNETRADSAQWNCSTTILRLNSEAGISLLEFSLIAPVLFFLLFSLLELARYMAIRTMLLQAADVALTEAQTGPNLGTDIYRIPCTDPQYLEFVAARRRALGLGAALAARSFITMPSEGGRADLTSFLHVDRCSTGPNFVMEPGALIRPGEHAYQYPSGNSDSHHPTLCPPEGGCTPGVERIVAPPAWRATLRRHPYVVQFQVTFRPFFGILDWSFPILVRRTGMREVS
jgi:hypothetical protein